MLKMCALAILISIVQQAITNTYYNYEFEKPAICIEVDIKGDSSFKVLFVGM